MVDQESPEGNTNVSTLVLPSGDALSTIWISSTILGCHGNTKWYVETEQLSQW